MKHCCGETPSHGQGRTPRQAFVRSSLTETKMDYVFRPIISLSKKTPKDKQETVTPKWLLGTVFFFKYLLICTYMGVCLHLSLHHMHAWSPKSPEEGVRSPRTGVIDGCESPCGPWESNPGHLEEEPMLLTIEPSILPLVCFVKAILPYGGFP